MEMYKKSGVKLFHWVGLGLIAGKRVVELSDVITLDYWIAIFWALVLGLSVYKSVHWGLRYMDECDAEENGIEWHEWE